MADFVKATIPAEEMLRTSDIAEALRFLLRVSPICVVPEIVFQRPGEAIDTPASARRTERPGRGGLRPAAARDSD